MSRVGLSRFGDGEEAWSQCRCGLLCRCHVWSRFWQRMGETQ